MAVKGGKAGSQCPRRRPLLHSIPTPTPGATSWLSLGLLPETRRRVVGEEDSSAGSPGGRGALLVPSGRQEGGLTLQPPRNQRRAIPRGVEHRAVSDCDPGQGHCVSVLGAASGSKRRGPATCHAQGGCGRLYNPCMCAEGLCNLRVLRLRNMYVQNLATCMCQG